MKVLNAEDINESSLEKLTESCRSTLNYEVAAQHNKLITIMQLASPWKVFFMLLSREGTCIYN